MAPLTLLIAVLLILLVGCAPGDRAAPVDPGGTPSPTAAAPHRPGPAPAPERAEPEPAPDDPVAVYLAPLRRCDPDGSGRSRGTAVCDLAEAEQRIQQLRQAGLARGDITVRFAGGAYDLGTYRWRTWAEPGATLRFVPDWWTPGIEEPAGPLPEFRGDGTASHWLSVIRNVRSDDPVGTLEIAHLEVSGYTNGIMVNGGLFLEHTSDERATPVEPPLPYVAVDHVVIKDLGNRGNATAEPAEWALALRNVASGSVRSSRFEWIANAAGDEKYAHAIYAMESEGVSVTDNVFYRVSGDPVRLRNDNSGFLVLRNRFVRSGSRAAVSDWHVDAEAAREREQGWEVSSEKPGFRGNRLSDGSYDGGDVVLWRPSEDVR